MKIIRRKQINALLHAAITNTTLRVGLYRSNNSARKVKPLNKVNFLQKKLQDWHKTPTFYTGTLDVSVNRMCKTELSQFCVFILPRVYSGQGLNWGGSRRISDPAPLIWDPLPPITDHVPHNWDPATFLLGSSTLLQFIFEHFSVGMMFSKKCSPSRSFCHLPLSMLGVIAE